MTIVKGFTELNTSWICSVGGRILIPESYLSSEPLEYHFERLWFVFFPRPSPALIHVGLNVLTSHGGQHSTAGSGARPGVASRYARGKKIEREVFDEGTGNVHLVDGGDTMVEIE